MQQVLFVIVGLYAAMILFLLYHWLASAEFAPGKDYFPIKKVTVIVPFRNEEQCIAKCIDSLASQNFPENLLEAVLVNDHSRDASVQKAEETIRNTNVAGNFTIIHLEETETGKKAALKKGIQNAKGEIIAATDADCIHHPDWLKTLSAKLDESGSDMVCGQVALHDEKGFLGKMQSLDILALQAASFASANAGFPLMCNGAGLIFRKEIFQNEMLNNTTATGDDTFLMFSVWKKNRRKIAFLKSRAFVLTKGEQTLSGFIQQRKRWASKVSKYKQPHVVITGIIVFLANFSVVLSGALAFIYPAWVIFFFKIFFCKTATDFVFLFAAAKHFKKQKLMWYFIPACLFEAVYTSLITLITLPRSFEWKGRRVK